MWFVCLAANMPYILNPVYGGQMQFWKNGEFKKIDGSLPQSMFTGTKHTSKRVFIQKVAVMEDLDSDYMGEQVQLKHQIVFSS